MYVGAMGFVINEAKRDKHFRERLLGGRVGRKEIEELNPDLIFGSGDAEKIRVTAKEAPNFEEFKETMTEYIEQKYNPEGQNT